MDIRTKIRHLLSQNVSPQKVAAGSAIGMFFGVFPPFPLFGLKTALSYFSSLALRVNATAAIIGVTLHDLFLPLLPVILRWEYQIGYWLLANPHHLPPRMKLHNLETNPFHHWHDVERIGGPLVLGAAVIGLAAAAVTYAVIWWIFRQRQRRHDRRAALALVQGNDI